MFWESLVCVMLGFTASYAAVRRFPERFRYHQLALVTGAAGAFFGGILARAVLGPGQLPVVLVLGLVVSGVLLSLLVETSQRQAGPAGSRHRAAAGGLLP